MGHLYILCGPPGAGKTTFLREVEKRNLPFEQLQRMTTRSQRKEEGDKGKFTLEYEFLSPEEFAERLSRVDIANFIEWNGNLYATDIDELNKAFDSEKDYILFEDIPSAVALKRRYGSRVTVMLIFPEDEDDFKKIVFSALKSSQKSSIAEWKRRLGLKYDESVKIKGELPDENDRQNYIEKKMNRAIPDLAFIAGKIRQSVDIRVLANRKNYNDDETVNMDDTIQEFLLLAEEVKKKHISKSSEGKFAFVLMPFNDDFNKIYEFVIKPAIEERGLSCLRGDEIFTELDVPKDIMKHIESSKLIISDISGGNPNVFLELGVSINLKKPLILLSQDTEAPFNVRTCRWIKYEDSLDGWRSLSNQIAGAVDKIKFSSGLSD